METNNEHEKIFIDTTIKAEIETFKKMEVDIERLKETALKCDKNFIQKYSSLFEKIIKVIE